MKKGRGVLFDRLVWLNIDGFHWFSLVLCPIYQGHHFFRKVTYGCSICVGVLGVSCQEFEHTSLIRCFAWKVHRTDQLTWSLEPPRLYEVLAWLCYLRNEHTEMTTPMGCGHLGQLVNISSSLAWLPASFRALR